MHRSSQGRCTFCQNMIRFLVTISRHTCQCLAAVPHTHSPTPYSHSYSVLTFPLHITFPLRTTFPLHTHIPTLHSHSHSLLTFPLHTHISTLHSHSTPCSHSHSALTFPLHTHVLSTSPRCIHHRYVISQQSMY